MPSDTSAAAENTKAIDWNNVAERPRFPRGHPRAGQFVPVNDPPPTAPFVGKLDQRTQKCQRYLDHLDGYLSHCAAADNCNKSGLCEELAGMRTELAEYRTRYLAGERVDVQEWLMLRNAFRRYSVTLGLERAAKDVTNLHDYIREQDAGQ